MAVRVQADQLSLIPTAPGLAALVAMREDFAEARARFEGLEPSWTGEALRKRQRQLEAEELAALTLDSEGWADPPPRAKITPAGLAFIRDRFLALEAAKVWTKADLARELGWFVSGEPDGRRIGQTLGLHEVVRRNGRKRRETITCATALKFCEALGIAPTDIEGLW